MVNVHLACSYDKRILPYLHKPLAPPDELRLMGQDGEYVAVHPQLASTLLKLVMETSSVIVPDAPIAAMQELAGELIDLQVPLGAVVDASLFDLMASTVDGNCAVND